jgi:malic enzyme
VKIYNILWQLVAVISNGTAVLGLGGYAGLKTRYGRQGSFICIRRDIECFFDIELNTEDPEELIERSKF